MSMNGPGQYASYTPPTPSLEPPGRKPKSPWLYVSLGCGFLILLAFGGCVGAGVMFSNRMKQEMSQPVTEAQATRDIGDTPRYPGAKLDTQTTHAARLAMTLMKTLVGAKGESGGAGFTTPDSFLKVLTWYDEKLRALGYKPGKEQSNGYTYQKGTEVLMLQSTRTAKTDTGTQFMILHFQNAHLPGASQ